VEYFTISQFIDGKIIETLIIDNGPKYDSAGYCMEDNDEPLPNTNYGVDGL
jgi:hypothetical protein